MRTRIRNSIIIGLAAAAVALSACSPETATTDAGTTTVPATQSGDEGELVDVGAQLIKQGFKQEQLSAIQKNSAYWLMPFQTPLEMSKKPKPGNKTCMFRMVNKTYKGTGPVAAHRIRLNSTVTLTPHLVGSDGKIGAAIGDPEPVTVEAKFRELTPAWPTNTGDSAFDLGICSGLTAQ